MRTIKLLGILVAALTYSGANAAIIYDESVMPDLSNSGLAPTVLTGSLGSNQVLGVTGRGAAAVDRDYLTLIIPSGLQLSSIILLPNAVVGGVLSFIGVQAGNQLTLPVTATDAVGLLGWSHYSAADLNTNILTTMAIPALGSSGFTPPLPSGPYTFWIQDFNAAPLAYGFDFQLTSVPEPGTSVMLLSAAGALACMLRLRRRA